MRRGSAVFGAVVVACALLPVQATGVGTVAGTVTLTAVRSAPLATSVYGRRGVPPKPGSVGPETRKVVVYLASPKLAPASAPMHAAIEQRGEQFDPPVTVVTAGSTVDFPNEDPYFHNVFSLSRVATFDLGRYPSGTSRSQVFDRPGLVKVFCHLHSQMSALVMVLEHPWFTIPAETGSYTLPPVTPGEYTLVAWHERIGEQREKISVAAGGTTRVSFTLPVLEGER
jgi:plastocyanin